MPVFGGMGVNEILQILDLVETWRPVGSSQLRALTPARDPRSDSSSPHIPHRQPHHSGAAARLTSGGVVALAKRGRGAGGSTSGGCRPDVREDAEQF